MTPRHEALETLLSSIGWQILCDASLHEFRERLDRGLKTALNDPSDDQALSKLRQIQAAKDAVDWLVRWPQEELDRLQRQTPKPSEDRRPPLPLGLSGQGRRGGL